MRAIESWALRRAFVGSQTRGYGSHLARVLREAKAAAAVRDDIADAVITGLQGGTLSWPSDAELLDAFQTRRFYDGMSQLRLRLLLGSIDHLLRTEDAREPTAVIKYDNLQIERIIPAVLARTLADRRQRRPHAAARRHRPGMDCAQR